MKKKKSEKEIEKEIEKEKEEEEFRGKTAGPRLPDGTPVQTYTN